MISALASKTRLNQKKNKGMPLFFFGPFKIILFGAFLFDHFLEVRAEILKKNFVGFLGDLKTLKGRFEIN